MITLIVFSKDRAMQLDSLLRSVKDHCTGIDSIWVVMKSSNELHFLANNRVCVEHQIVKGHPAITLLEQEDDLGGLGWHMAWALKEAQTGHTAFAVDDMIFYRPSDFSRAAGVLDSVPAFVWSWRYGADRPHSVRAGFDFWRGPGGYAWHVDGSLYRTTDYVRTLSEFYPDWRAAVQTPNDLEGVVASQMDARNNTLVHVGPLEATCMTWQINQAHATTGVTRAPFVAIPETQLDALAEAYLAGRRVDNAKLYADLSWTTRFQKRAGQSHVEACVEAAMFYASLIR